MNKGSHIDSKLKIKIFEQFLDVLKKVFAKSTKYQSDFSTISFTNKKSNEDSKIFNIIQNFKRRLMREK